MQFNPDLFTEMISDSHIYDQIGEIVCVKGVLSPYYYIAMVTPNKRLELIEEFEEPYCESFEDGMTYTEPRFAYRMPALISEVYHAIQS